MSFLPENYQPPQSSNSGGGGYMKLLPGDNKLRILTPPLLGYLYWNIEDKPVRLRAKPDFMPHDKRGENKWGQAEKVKHFWAMGVWNFQEEQPQILEITQLTIMQGLSNLCCDPDWGDPRQYSLKIVKAGERQEVTYSVIPAPIRPIPADIQAKIDAQPLALDALIHGANPFSEQWESEAQLKSQERLDQLVSNAVHIGAEVPSWVFDVKTLEDFEKAIVVTMRLIANNYPTGNKLQPKKEEEAVF